jgi:hypothetical protein
MIKTSPIVEAAPIEIYPFIGIAFAIVAIAFIIKEIWFHKP